MLPPELLALLPVHLTGWRRLTAEGGCHLEKHGITPKWSVRPGICMPLCRDLDGGISMPQAATTGHSKRCLDGSAGSQVCVTVCRYLEGERSTLTAAAAARKGKLAGAQRQVQELQQKLEAAQAESALLLSSAGKRGEVLMRQHREAAARSAALSECGEQPKQHAAATPVPWAAGRHSLQSETCILCQGTLQFINCPKNYFPRCALHRLAATMQGTAAAAGPSQHKLQDHWFMLYNPLTCGALQRLSTTGCSSCCRHCNSTSSMTTGSSYTTLLPARPCRG